MRLQKGNGPPRRNLLTTAGGRTFLAVPLCLMPVQAAAVDPLASIDPVLGMWVGVAATILAFGAALR